MALDPWEVVLLNRGPLFIFKVQKLTPFSTLL